MDSESIKAINVAHCAGKNVFSRSLVGKNETIGGFHFMDLYRTAHCIFFCRCETIYNDFGDQRAVFNIALINYFRIRFLFKKNNIYVSCVIFQNGILCNITNGILCNITNSIYCMILQMIYCIILQMIYCVLLQIIYCVIIQMVYCVIWQMVYCVI